MPGLLGKRHRVIVEWSHPEGTSEFLCLEVRTGGSTKAIERGVAELADWIESRRDASEGPDAPAEADLPFRSTVADAAVVFCPDRTTLKSKLTGLAVAAPAFLVSSVIVMIVTRLAFGRGSFAIFAGLPYGFALAAYYWVQVVAQRRHGA